jgi:PKD repeat protein
LPRQKKLIIFVLFKNITKFDLTNINLNMKRFLNLSLLIVVFSYNLISTCKADCIPVDAVLGIQKLNCGQFKFHIELVNGSSPWVQWTINGKTKMGSLDTVVRFTNASLVVCKIVIGNNCSSVTLDSTFNNNYTKPVLLKVESEIKECSDVLLKPKFIGNTSDLNFIWTGDDMMDIHDSEARHTYTMPGKYSYKIYANNSCGDQFIYDGKITIENTVSCNAGNDLRTCIDAGAIKLNGKPFGGQWFGKGIRGNMFYPELAGNGEHTMVYLYKLNGCVATDTLIAQVEKLEVEADFIQSSNIVPSAVLFANYSKGKRIKSVWNFGDGNSSLLTNPEHIYTNPGTYIVTLDIYDEELGCMASKTLTKYITVEPLLFIPSNNIITYNNRINITPNPSLGQIQVSIDKSAEVNEFDVQLTDIYGKVLVSYNNLTQDHLTFAVPHWPSGVFIVRVLCNDGSEFSQKFVTLR